MAQQRNSATWDSARGIVAQRAKQFEAALRSDASAGRIRPIGFEPWMAAVAADFQRQPKLCDAAVQAPETVWECLSVAANLGLLPGSGHKSFYLIPRWNGRHQRMECTYIIGYQGYAELAMRHPRVHKAEGFVVYRGEEFSFDPGAGKLTHKWDPDVDRSDENVVAAYSRVVLTIGSGTVTDPEPLAWVMSRKELEAARDRSDGWKAFKANKIKSTPWSTDFAAMCRKTAMRRHYGGGSVPRSADLILAVDSEIRHEEQTETVSEVAAEQANASLRSALSLTTEAPSVTLPDAKEMDPIDAEFHRHVERMGGGQ